jgi:hypothetical protein
VRSTSEAPQDGRTGERSVVLEHRSPCWVSIVPRLVDHSDAFCWPSNEVLVGE